MLLVSVVLNVLRYFVCVFVDFREVSWLPGRPRDPGGPSESSGGSRELPG